MPQPEAGHGSVRVTVPVYGEPAGPTGMVKVCVVTRIPEAVAASDSVRDKSRQQPDSRSEEQRTKVGKDVELTYLRMNRFPKWPREELGTRWQRNQ